MEIRLDAAGESYVDSAPEHLQGIGDHFRRVATDRSAGVIRQGRDRGNSQEVSRGRQEIWLPRTDDTAFHGLAGGCGPDERKPSGRSVQGLASRHCGLSPSLESTGCACQGVRYSWQHRAGGPVLPLIAKREPSERVCKEKAHRDGGQNPRTTVGPAPAVSTYKSPVVWPPIRDFGRLSCCRLIHFAAQVRALNWGRR